MPGIRPGEIHTPWHEFWRRFRRQPVAMGAGIFVLLLIAVAIVAPWIAPYDAENYFDYDRLNEGPSLVHWFGVDSLGRDIFSRVLVGAQISLAAGVLAVLIGAAIGTVLNLKPVLRIKGEKLDAFSKTRGWKAAKKAMIEAVRRTMDTDFADSQGPENLYVAAAYTGDADSAQEWKGELEEAFPGFDIYMAPLSLSVACHIGPGARAVTVTKLLHIEDKR